MITKVNFVIIIFALALPPFAHSGPLTPEKLTEFLVEMTSSDIKVAGKASVEILNEAENINVSIVRGAIAQVGDFQDFRAFPHLVKMLEGKKSDVFLFDDDTRALCAVGIGNIFGNRGFTPTTKDGKEETDPLFSGDNAVDALLAHISLREDIRVRSASVQALGKSCSPKAIPPLKALVNDPQENPELQALSIRSITSLTYCIISRGLIPPDPSGDPLPYPLLTDEVLTKAMEWLAGTYGNLLSLMPLSLEKEGGRQ